MTACNSAEQNSIDRAGIQIEVPANDLVHVGTDTDGHNHYWDAPNQRFLVVDAHHERVTKGILIYHRLDVAPTDVVHVQTDGPTDNLAAWIEFVATEVDDLDWDGDPVQIIDPSEILPAGGFL